MNEINISFKVEAISGLSLGFEFRKILFNHNYFADYILNIDLLFFRILLVKKN